MEPLTYWLAAQFMGGTVLFVGLVLVCLATVLRSFLKKRFARSATAIAAVLGALFVVASATPFSLWVYAVWGALLAGAWTALWRGGNARHVFAALLLLASAIMAVMELPRHMPPEINTAGCDTLFVVGDSLSGGADSPERNWPELLGEKLGLPAQNLSFPGAMLDTALRNVNTIDGSNPLVILEIGGNDLLNGRNDFEPNLERLLAEVCASNRRVVMLELPLPPFFNAYGMAQRRLAREYGVVLVPKRSLAGVLAAPGATVDGLHLSNLGHALLAESLRPIFK